jgi:hypothetical protein
MNAALDESPTDPERSRLIDVVTKEAAAHLGVDLARDTPAHIVEIINEVIVKIVFKEPQPIPDCEEKDLVLGSLWGSQMVREFGWYWVNIQVDGALDVAVVSPSRDMAIFPFTFVADCIAKRCVCTVALSFNMLLERKGEIVFEPKSYEYVMAHVRHIVPPYTLEPIG